jgi:hypothetical protein
MEKSQRCTPPATQVDGTPLFGNNQLSEGLLVALSCCLSSISRLIYVCLIRQAGITSANGIAAEFNRRGVTTPRGGRWPALQVQRLFVRLGAGSSS